MAITLRERNTARQYIRTKLNLIAPCSIPTRILAHDAISHVHKALPMSKINVFHIFGIISGFTRRREAIIKPRIKGASGICIPSATPSTFHPHPLMPQAHPISKHCAGRGFRQKAPTGIIKTTS